LSRVTLLAGGVGGARLARGLAAVLGPDELTTVVNVGDDDRMHGVHVSADLDTVTYTLAGREGPQGWGLAGDTHTTMEALEDLGVDTSFRIGDRDLATCMMRTAALDRGEPLSNITARLCAALGVRHPVLPATDDRLRTRLRTSTGEWLAFQDYFVIRRHEDEIVELEFAGATDAVPAPGVLDAITEAEAIVIAPSNPPLSIQPILEIPALGGAVRDADRVIAVSPLFAGRALKGPADRVMASLGLPAGNEGVLAAYDGIIDTLVVDDGDAGDVERFGGAIDIHARDTRIARPEAAARFATWLLDLL
jgi:LPPG:FO 2-phospho-L-lactate transferase